MHGKAHISIIIPILNEEKIILELYNRLSSVLTNLNYGYEIIFIDDGSYDNSFNILRNLHEKDKNIKIIKFSRNFGHQIAITAGLHYVSGDCVIVMDGDLQDPPEVVVEMIKKWRQGFDVVYGVRRHRKETWIKRACYRIFYLLLYKMSPLRIPRDVGDFCLMDKRVVLEMRKLCEKTPFIRGLRTWVGFKQTGIEYDRPVRGAGRPKYNIIGLFRLAFDGMLSFSSVPLRAATILGLIVSFISIVYALYIAANRILIVFGFIDATHLISGWATLVCSIMLLMGMQLIFLGILGEYIGRIFIQVKGRPLFVVDEKVGFEDNE